jgi:hypothetical protein
MHIIKKIKVKDSFIANGSIMEDLERLKSPNKEIILEKEIIKDRVTSLLWQGNLPYKEQKGFFSRLFNFY